MSGALSSDLLTPPRITTVGERPITATLDGIPETTLWTLHNRAREALRIDRILDDPVAAQIYGRIDYTFDRNFGAPDGSHALRASLFDDGVRDWATKHPDGRVVELGCGLETQFFRCDNGRLRWLAVDVDDAIALRTQLIRHPRCQPFVGDARSLKWLEMLDTSESLCVTAQGLLMYFSERDAQNLLRNILIRRPDTTILFDVVPLWFSSLSRWGLRKTRHYRAPPMPWGLNRSQIPAWTTALDANIDVEVRPYGPVRGPLGFLFRHLSSQPGFREHVGHVVRIRRAP